MILSAGVGPHTSDTASQISSAKSSSVLVKLSGEYSRRSRMPESTSGRQSRLSCSTARTAIRTISCFGRLKTYSRCLGDVEL